MNHRSGPYGGSNSRTSADTSRQQNHRLIGVHGSGSRGDDAPAGGSYPVREYRHRDREQRRADSDHGDLPAGHAARQYGAGRGLNLGCDLGRRDRDGRPVVRVAHGRGHGRGCRGTSQQAGGDRGYGCGELAQAGARRERCPATASPLADQVCEHGLLLVTLFAPGWPGSSSLLARSARQPGMTSRGQRAGPARTVALKWPPPPLIWPNKLKQSARVSRGPISEIVTM